MQNRKKGFTISDIIDMATALQGAQSVYNDKDIAAAIAKIKGLFTEEEFHVIETKANK
ncbi:MAG: hypothetical protein LBG43_08260 [Treponema sp.]|nr:hypothetical protein [Treponema sp.]